MLLTNSEVYELVESWRCIVRVIVDLYSSLSDNYGIYYFVTDVFSVLYEIVYICSRFAKGCLSFSAVENRE
jgi:hypothetical protein